MDRASRPGPVPREVLSSHGVGCSYPILLQIDWIRSALRCPSSGPRARCRDVQSL